MIRTYTELIQLASIEERFDYLQLQGSVGSSTFGFDRWLNQKFYHSYEWRSIRNHVIARDYGYDLGDPDFVIKGPPAIHHMNPVTLEQLDEGNPDMFDPEFLISCAHATHNAIHYGDRSQLPQVFVERHPGDTKLW